MGAGPTSDGGLILPASIAHPSGALELCRVSDRMAAQSADKVNALGSQDSDTAKLPSLLADLRVTAMRPSLQALGRFDPERARARFLSTFDAQATWLIERRDVDRHPTESDVLGLIVVRSQADGWLLDHLYLVDAAQGQGIGAAVVQALFRQADAAQQPIRVGALRGSPANQFYQRLGFVELEQADWDVYYRRQPQPLRR